MVEVPSPHEPSVRSHTARDGYGWRYRQYPAANPFLPLARLVVIHGIQSHGGWYEYSCRHLAAAGFEVLFLDRRGSGLNERDRGDAPSFWRLLDDLVEFIEPLRLARPWRPTFLAAISWGGKTATALQRYRPGVVDGLALLCPGFFPVVSPSWRERAKIGLSFLAAPRTLCPIPLNDPELFTASPEWRKFLRDDPLSLHQATARFFISSLRLDRYLRRTPPFVKTPVLLQLAGQDRILDNARTRRYVESFATRNLQIKEYPEAHHTLEFEPRPHPYLADLAGWLTERARALAAPSAP